MTFGLFGRWIRPQVAAVVVALGVAGTLAASDNPPLPAAPAAAASCANCAQPAAPCPSCGKSLLGHGHKCRITYEPHLCPGACFGYFQTQWHRWDEVCPIPYQGVGVSDAPPVPTPRTTTPTPLGPPSKMPPVDQKKNTELPDPNGKGQLPRQLPLPANTTGTNQLPTIPTAPRNN
jgi:hypothetical protein